VEKMEVWQLPHLRGSPEYTAPIPRTVPGQDLGSYAWDDDKKHWVLVGLSQGSVHTCLCNPHSLRPEQPPRVTEDVHSPGDHCRPP
jgi:hypothetical protein